MSVPTSASPNLRAAVSFLAELRSSQHPLLQLGLACLSQSQRISEVKQASLIYTSCNPGFQLFSGPFIL